MRMWLFHYSKFGRNYDVFKLKVFMLSVEKKVRTNKNETETEVGNPTHRDMNNCLSKVKKREKKRASHQLRIAN